MIAELTVLATVSLACHSLLVAVEAAYAQVDREILATRSADGSGTASSALALLQAEPRLFGTTLAGAQAALLLTGIAGTVVAGSFASSPWVALLIGVPLFSVGEVLARSVGHHHAEEVAQIAARPLKVLQFALAPLVWMASGVLQALRAQAEASATLSREEIVRLLDDDEAIIDPEDRELIRRALELNETQVDDCMTPLVDVQALPENTLIPQAVELMLQSGFSRLPVFRDRIDNMVGMVTHRELLYLGPEVQTVGEIAKAVQFVPETKRVADLLREMRKEHGHFAVVVDEYGGVVGLVTIEDLVEEVVGEIRDERDTEEPAIRRLSEREWRVPARTELEELEDALGMELPEGDYETVAGFILAAIGRIPEMGEVIRIRGFTFRIEQASDRAIQLVHLTVPRTQSS